MSMLPDGTSVSEQITETWEEVVAVIGAADFDNVPPATAGESFGATLSVTDDSGSSLGGFETQIDLVGPDGSVVQTQSVETGSNGEATAGFEAPLVSSESVYTVRTRIDALVRQTTDLWEEVVTLNVNRQINEGWE